MRIGLVGRQDDPQLCHLAATLAARGCEVAFVDFATLLAGAPFAFADGRWWAGGLDLATCDCLFVDKLPGAAALLGPAQEPLAPAELFGRHKEQQERVAFARGALLDLERCGVRVLPSRVHAAPYDDKPAQFALLLRSGVPLPRTLITNDPARARAFTDAVGDVVVKPAAGGAAARLVPREALDAISSSPVILQEHVRGEDVRVTVVDGRVVSAVIIERAGDDAIDVRATRAYRSGAVRYTPIELPADVAALAVRVSALCAQPLSGIDLKRTQQGFVVLEANSAPRFLEIEQRTGAPITAALAACLTEQRGR